MSESVTLPTDLPIDGASDAVPAPPASGTGPSDRSTTGVPVPARPFAPTDPRAMLELIASALAPDADDATRAGAREVWAQLAQSIATATPMIPTAPVMAPAMPALPVMPTVPLPTSPIAMAARALRQMPPDQLLDLVLQRLRAALPAGTTVPAPKGIHFQFVPQLPPPPPPGER